jgi:hypothetical protein
MRSNLTINFGLRYDYATPVSELYHRLVNLSIIDGYRQVTAITGASVQSPEAAGARKHVRQNGHIRE